MYTASSSIDRLAGEIAPAAGLPSLRDVRRPSRPSIRVIEASDGYPLHYRHWQPQQRPAGYIVAVHGIQSHSGWYEYSSRRLCDVGFQVAFLDRRGSGLNHTRRGLGVPPGRLVGDVAQLLTRVRHERDQRAPEAPVFLLSVSWGGKLAAATCARRPDLVDGLALLYPGIHIQFAPKWHQKLRLRMAVDAGWGHVQVPIPLGEPERFTDEPQWQEYIRRDPLALRKISLSFLLASRMLDRSVLREAGAIRCPVLLMLAGRDRIIDNRATKRGFLRRLGTQDRTLIEYPDARHTLEFEPNRDEFIGDLSGWLSTIAARPRS